MTMTALIDPPKLLADLEAEILLGTLAEPGQVRQEILPPWGDNHVQGLIYLLHFIDPVTYEHARFRHAGHYLGWTKNLPQRLRAHGTKEGANLLWYVKQAGIAWVVVRTWEGTRLDEARIKDMGGLSRSCPGCGVRPMAKKVQKRVSLRVAK